MGIFRENNYIFEEKSITIQGESGIFGKIGTFFGDIFTLGGNKIVDHYFKGTVSQKITGVKSGINR